MQNLNELAKEVHEGNVARGFYEVQPTLETQLMLVITELSEAVEADRKGRYAEIGNFELQKEKGISFEQSFIVNIKDTFEDEIADAFIRLLDIAGNRGLTIVEYKDHQVNIINIEQSKCDAIFDLCMLFERAREVIDGLVSVSIYYLLKLSARWNIALDFHVTEKLKYNSTRPYKHGKNY